ncbi:MAG TPA: ATP-binding protein [Acidimicrobiales bacterium]|nr:ATP-binding protein [Acidimicrobiales bacterium]
MTAPAPTPLRLRQLLGRLFILSGLIVAAAALAASLAFIHLDNERNDLFNRIDPATSLVTELLANYLDQETGVRGYALSHEELFLTPYNGGVSGAQNADRALTRLLPPGTPDGRLLAVVHQRARAWSQQFAIPSVAATQSGDRSFNNTAELTTGLHLFDSLRQSFTGLQQRLGAEGVAAHRKLNSASEELVVTMIVSLIVLLVDGLVIWTALRRQIVDPLSSVAADARVVTSGDLEHEVRRAGPSEIADLASDIEAMRQRIFADFGTARDAQTQLAETNAELARSNEDLEQFAYVASHDLQEPLRKVASFCQLLEQRYGGQLDERGEQYITFAVDGAKRMQVLINDLLAFSRIGRTTEGFVAVELTDCFDQAVRHLHDAIDNAGATVSTVGRLPAVQGDRTLLTALFQNLIGNAIKFRGEAPPLVTVAAEEDPDSNNWRITITDNGIGIEPRFAERIFVIFQRLHGRDSYAGTGIGLAMCRKIVEFHGGRIWLDTDYDRGTRFRFTIPPVPSEEASSEPPTVSTG